MNAAGTEFMMMFSRTNFRLAGLLAVAFLLATFSAWSAQKRDRPTHEASQRLKADLSDQFFSNGPIPYLRIQIKSTNLAALQRNDRAYVPATVREGDIVYTDVGIHLKGAAGSKRDLNDKPALTLNFDRFQDRQK